MLNTNTLQKLSKQIKNIRKRFHENKNSEVVNKRLPNLVYLNKTTSPQLVSTEIEKFISYSMGFSTLGNFSPFGDAYDIFTGETVEIKHRITFEDELKTLDYLQIRNFIDDLERYILIWFNIKNNNKISILSFSLTKEEMEYELEQTRKVSKSHSDSEEKTVRLDVNGKDFNRWIENYGDSSVSRKLIQHTTPSLRRFLEIYKGR